MVLSITRMEAVISSKVVLVVLGWFLGVLSGHVGEWLARRRERQNLGRAIGAEITSLLAVVHRRRYVEHLEATITRMRETNEANVFAFPVHFNPFQVYESNLARIGTLASPLAELIVRFYAQAAAVLSDVKLGEQWYQNPVPVAVEELIARHVELHALFVDTISLGREIAVRVGSKQPDSTAQRATCSADQKALVPP